MTPEETEALAHRWHMDLTQKGNLEVADEILTRGFVAHVNGQDMPGVEGAKQLATAIRTAFPDVRVSHHEAIVSGNSVAIRWTADATHQGEYFGVPPTEKQIHVEGIDLFHIEGGKLAEAWIEYDNLALLQQMGVAPQPEQARA